MKRVIVSFMFMLFLVGCSGEDSIEYNNEKFTLGESLTYEMPILESEVLIPSNYESTLDNVKSIVNGYSFNDTDNYLSIVEVDYKLQSYDSEEMPYYVYPMDESIAVTYDMVNEEMIEINGIQWLHMEYEPMYFDAEAESMVSITHEYQYRSSFELYTYRFILSDTEEKFDDQELMDNSFERIEEILSMAEFTRNPSLEPQDIINKLNGTWDAADAGYLQFRDNEINWYRTAEMDENNVIHIEIAEAEAIIHPTQDIEYANLKIEYLSQVVDGQTYDSEEKYPIFINFQSDNQIVIVDVKKGIIYDLTKVD